MDITKETLLKAEDPKNRDAILYDILHGIDKKMSFVVELKGEVVKCEKQISYLKGIGTTITAIFGAALAWLAKS